MFLQPLDIEGFILKVNKIVLEKVLILHDLIQPGVAQRLYKDKNSKL